MLTTDHLERDIFEDAVIGTVLAAGSAGRNLARTSVFTARLPVPMCIGGGMAAAVLFEVVYPLFDFRSTGLGVILEPRPLGLPSFSV